jgi:iron complex transport system substrate-binding protein
MRNSLKLSAILILAAAVMGACRGSTVAPNAADAPKHEPRAVTDDMGRRVTVPAAVTRVVSLAPSVTEIIFAVGAGDRLVGVTTFCNYPEQARSIAKIGDTMTPNMETIVALRPDVVFVSSASQLEGFTKLLEQNGIAVYVIDPQSLPDLYGKSLRQLGTLFDKYDDASRLADSLERRHRDICRITNGCAGRAEGGTGPAAVRVFVQVSREPLFTVGRSSFLSQVIRDAGGILATENVETAFPKLSKETASALNPEVLILSDSEDNKEPNDAFKNAPAVKNGRVYRVNADLISRPGPRLIDALEQIARDLHPEKFR